MNGGERVIHVFFISNPFIILQIRVSNTPPWAEKTVAYKKKRVGGEVVKTVKKMGTRTKKGYRIFAINKHPGLTHFRPVFPVQRPRSMSESVWLACFITL